MITVDQQAILDNTTGHLLTNRREFRWARADGVFNIGWLARLINLGLVQALKCRLTPKMVAAMVVDVMPLNQSEQIGAFADLTLMAPCLAYARADGSGVLIDGLKRAKQNFEAGRPDVPVRVVRLDDARRLGMSAQYRESWKVLEATEYHPVGAGQKRNFDKVIIEVEDDREAEAPGRGQPSFSEQQRKLATCVTYYLVTLTELEFYIYKEHPGSSLFRDIRRGLTRPAWIEEFWGALGQSGMIPVAQSTSETANQAGAAIAALTTVGGRAGFKRRAKADWTLMSPKALAAERDVALEFCAAVMKADLRFRLRQTCTRTLVKWENNPQRKVHWRDVHSVMEGSDAHDQSEFKASRLYFDEQLIVTQVTGVNMNDVYHDHTNRDPLFQAYAFAFNIGRHRKALADPCMVETIVHRRAMSILGQRDNLSDCWEGLFEYWQRLGLTDTVLLDMSRRLDAEHCVYDGINVRCP